MYLSVTKELFNLPSKIGTSSTGLGGAIALFSAFDLPAPVPLPHDVGKVKSAFGGRKNAFCIFPPYPQLRTIESLCPHAAGVLTFPTSWGRGTTTRRKKLRLLVLLFLVVVDEVPLYKKRPLSESFFCFTPFPQSAPLPWRPCRRRRHRCHGRSPR